MPWRLRITGIESLNWLAISWASLKALGITRWTWSIPTMPLPPTGRSTRVSRPASLEPSSAKMSSNSSRRRRWSLRTLGRSR